MNQALPLYLLARNCFGADFCARMVDAVCEQSGHWQMAGTGAGDKFQVGGGNGRMGWILPPHLEPEDLLRTFMPWLIDCLDAATHRLGLPRFEDHEVEVQVTAYHNRGGYTQHTDNGADQPEGDKHPHAGRRLSFVYYFHDEPKPFTGGHLDFPEHGEQVEPTQDSLVCFRSETPHQVLPVWTSSKSPRSCRFTINGWISERGTVRA